MSQLKKQPCAHGAGVNSSGSPPVVEEFGPKVRFELAREIVRHEDGLINSRVTWLQAFQGLIFTAFFAGLGLLKENEVWSDRFRDQHSTHCPCWSASLYCKNGC